MADRPGHVLIIDTDQDIAHIVYAVLSDAGYLVSVLASVDPDAIRMVVGRLEPDCVLLDSASPSGYGTSWTEAAWLSHRDRQVAVIMFTVDLPAKREAREATSARSQAAGFHAVLNKPFDLDELLDVVAAAVGRSVPFDPSPAAEARRTERLRARLEAAGAQEIHLSTRREWANFKTADGTLVQLYWWQRDGVYYVIRHTASGGRLDQVGRFPDLDAAIAVGMSVRAPGRLKRWPPGRSAPVASRERSQSRGSRTSRQARRGRRPGATARRTGMRRRLSCLTPFLAEPSAEPGRAAARRQEPHSPDRAGTSRSVPVTPRAARRGARRAGGGPDYGRPRSCLARPYPVSRLAGDLARVAWCCNYRAGRPG